MVQQEITIEPVTRLEGHLGVYAKVDTDTKVYTDARSFGTMFRGWEIILKDREPADAIWITQRTCGVCPTPHGIAAAMTVDMA
jgi:hydrogenase large subunit